MYPQLRLALSAQGGARAAFPTLLAGWGSVRGVHLGLLWNGFKDGKWGQSFGCLEMK